MFRRRSREVPVLNTTSTADISFMLLIFFLVTSSMDTDQGLPRQLPPPEDSTLVEEVHVKDRNVLELQLDAYDRLTCNGEPATYDELALRVVEFVGNASNSPSLPEKSQREVYLMGLTEVSDRHVISVQIDRQTTYNAYFRMQNAIVKGYYHLRNELAKHRFGQSYAQCSQEQREAIAMVYPQRISEQLPRDEKGGEQ
ncbi:MAG: biopolymer transporter ExbD [Prevotella sp.]|nr:biopolymer transporter ExbD [Prevotella sp.]